MLCTYVNQGQREALGIRGIRPSWEKAAANLVLQPLLYEAGLFNLKKQKIKVFMNGSDLDATVL